MNEDTQNITSKYTCSTRCIRFNSLGSLEIFYQTFVCLDKLPDNEIIIALEHGFLPAVPIADNESRYITNKIELAEKYRPSLCPECKGLGVWKRDFGSTYCALCGQAWYYS